MKIIYPSIKYWSETNISQIEHIARCARICYRSEKGNDEKLVNSLWNNNHKSMFRHATKYFVVPINYFTDLARAKYFNNNPFIDYVETEYDIYISANLQWIKEHTDFYNVVSKYEVSSKDMFEYAKEYNDIYNIIRYTFKVTTQISTSRELNRVSPNNIAEQSTRYVYDDGTLCKPHWLSNELVDIYNNNKYDVPENNETDIYYIFSCEKAFNNYQYLIKTCGLNKQDARGVLPLDTATVCAYTYTGNEWKHILDLRYRGTTGKPHPNAYIIGEMIHNELQVITKGIIE